VTLHDVKARIEEFSDLAKRQFHPPRAHEPRSHGERRAVADFARDAARALQDRAALLALGRQAEAHRDLMITGRTHNVPAQPTTFGKRLAMFGQELLVGFTRLDELPRAIRCAASRAPSHAARSTHAPRRRQRESRSARGARIEASRVSRVARRRRQVYPRSLDFEVVTALHQVASAAASCSTTLRLMAGAGLLTEGFQAGQVGSSAMPHKVNARNCERVCGFTTILSGYVTMMSGLAGHQWNEGDVSCSVVRRVALLMLSLRSMGCSRRGSPCCSKWSFLGRGVGRKRTQPPLSRHHDDLDGSGEAWCRSRDRARGDQEHALAAAKALRSGNGDADLLGRLAGDRRVRARQKSAAINSVRKRALRWRAPHQVDAFLAEAKPLAKKVQRIGGLPAGSAVVGPPVGRAARPAAGPPKSASAQEKKLFTIFPVSAGNLSLPAPRAVRLLGRSRSLQTLF